MVFWVLAVEELVVEGACIAVAVVVPLIEAVAVLGAVAVLAAVALDSVAVAHIGLVAVEGPYSVGEDDMPVVVDNCFDSQAVAVDWGPAWEDS